MLTEQASESEKIQVHTYIFAIYSKSSFRIHPSVFRSLTVCMCVLLRFEDTREHIKRGSTSNKFLRTHRLNRPTLFHPTTTVQTLKPGDNTYPPLKQKSIHSFILSLLVFRPIDFVFVRTNYYTISSSQAILIVSRVSHVVVEIIGESEFKNRHVYRS